LKIKDQTVTFLETIVSYWKERVYS